MIRIKYFSNKDILLKPKFWVRNYPTNESWDLKLNALMDNLVSIVNKTRYTVTFEDDTEVWIGNHVYDYGTNSLQGNHLPSRKTALRLSYYVALNS